MSIQNFMVRKENYADIANQGQIERAAQEMAVMQAEGLVERADIEAVAKIKAAKHGASAIRAEGAAKGQSALVSGITGGLGGLGGALKGAFGGGGGGAQMPSNIGSDFYTMEGIGNFGKSGIDWNSVNSGLTFSDFNNSNYSDGWFKGGW